MKNKHSRKIRKKNKSRKNKSRKTKRGGFFGFFTSSPAKLPECETNNLVNLTTMETMHANYQKCCPKGFFGRKNSSPYCKQLDTNFKASFNGENNANEYYGTSDEINQMKQYNQQTSSGTMSSIPMSSSPMSPVNYKQNPNMAAGKKRRSRKQRKQ